MLPVPPALLPRCRPAGRLRRCRPRGLLGARGLGTSRPLLGTSPEDLLMGERAATRTNKTLDKISKMYRGQNFGYSKKYADNYEKVFGTGRMTADKDKAHPGGEIEFGDGPLGMEIEWSAPPVVTRVFPGGAAQRAGVEEGQAIVRIGGEDMALPLPELEVEDLMAKRPLFMQLVPARAADMLDRSSPQRRREEDVVRQLGVVRLPGALSVALAEELARFVQAERARSEAAAGADPSREAELFSGVRAPGAARERWDLRLPLEGPPRAALEELLGLPSAPGAPGLGCAFEALAGAGAELWELGAVVTEPGAAAQQVHADAPARCLYTAFVALQDVSEDMGPTTFFPGTNAAAAHRMFGQDPAGFLRSREPHAALLHAGDAVLYDSMVLHHGGANTSDKVRMLLYVTFRAEGADPRALGVEQHSIRGSLAGRFRLSDFRASSAPPAG